MNPLSNHCTFLFDVIAGRMSWLKVLKLVFSHTLHNSKHEPKTSDSAKYRNTQGSQSGLSESDSMSVGGPRKLSQTPGKLDSSRKLSPSIMSQFEEHQESSKSSEETNCTSKRVCLHPIVCYP